MWVKCTGNAFSLLCHLQPMWLWTSYIYESTDITELCFFPSPDVSCYVEGAPWTLILGLCPVPLSIHLGWGRVTETAELINLF